MYGTWGVQVIHIVVLRNVVGRFLYCGALGNDSSGLQR